MQKDVYIIIILHVCKRLNDFNQFWLVDTSQRHLKIFEIIVVTDSIKSTYPEASANESNMIVALKALPYLEKYGPVKARKICIIRQEHGLSINAWEEGENYTFIKILYKLNLSIWILLTVNPFYSVDPTKYRQIDNTSFSVDQFFRWPLVSFARSPSGTTQSPTAKHTDR